MSDHVNKKFKKQKGFTLVELLVVIALIAILAGVVFVALDPVSRFQDARNSKRFTNVETILTAIHACIVDNDGVMTTCLGSGVAADTEYEIVSNGISSDCNAICTDAATGDCIALLAPAPMQKYLKSLPKDPVSTLTAGHTGYQIEVDSNNLITITSCAVEGDYTYGGSNDISASR